MFEIISSWDTNLLIVILFIVWGIIKIMCCTWEVQTLKHFQSGVVQDFYYASQELLEIKNDTEKIKNFQKSRDC